MTAVDTDLSASSTPSAIAVSPEVERFVADTAQVATEGFALLRATRVLSPSATIQIWERVPGHDWLVGINHPNPWRSRTPRVEAAVYGFDTTPVLGDPAAARGARRFAAIFEQHADVTTVVHVHSPHLGAWAQVHRALPVVHGLLAAATPVPELPVYIDRRQAEVDFILAQIARDPAVPAIVEANGGGTVWGRDGLAAAVELIQVIEAAARATALAAPLGPAPG